MAHDGTQPSDIPDWYLFRIALALFSTTNLTASWVLRTTLDWRVWPLRSKKGIFSFFWPLWLCIVYAWLYLWWYTSSQSVWRLTIIHIIPVFSPGCYLDEWQVHPLNQVDACTWVSACQAPDQVPSPTDHLARCHPRFGCPEIIPLIAWQWAYLTHQ